MVVVTLSICLICLVSIGGSHQVQELVVDQTRPRLSKYIVDDSTGSLHLYFNEAVHKSTMDPTAITLTIYINAVPYQVHLQTATQIPSLSPSTIILNLDNSTRYAD